MKRNQLIALIAMLLLLAVVGALLPQAVIAYRKSQMRSVTWTQARRGGSLTFDEYPKQFGEIELSGNFSAQNIKNALQDLMITYIRAGLLPDMDIVNMTMPDYALYYDDQDREVLSATLQSGDDTVQISLCDQDRFPVFFSFQSPDCSMDADRFALLLPQHYHVKGGYDRTEDDAYHFVSQDGTLEFTVAPITMQNNHGIEMHAYRLAAAAQD